MKVIIPIKFIIGLTIICLVIFPILIYLLAYIMFYILTLGNSLVPHEVLFVILIFGAIIEIYFLTAPEYCKVVIKDKTISNFVFDGTNNDGWCESILNVKNIELVSKEKVQKYYKQFSKKQALLIDFGNYNVKYIYVGLFSKRQIFKLIKLISPN